MKSIDSIEVYAYNMCKDLVSEKEKIANENIKEHNSNWPQVPDYPFRISIIWASRSKETNSLFNLSSHQLDIDKIHFYAKDAYEA